MSDVWDPTTTENAVALILVGSFIYLTTMVLLVPPFRRVMHRIHDKLMESGKESSDG